MIYPFSPVFDNWLHRRLFENRFKGLTEEELLALDAELERDVIQPNPSYSLRAPTPPPCLLYTSDAADE